MAQTDTIYQHFVQVRKTDPKIVTGIIWRPMYMSKHDINGPWRTDALWKRGLQIAADIVLEWASFYWLWFLCGNSAFLIHRDCVSK